MKRSTERLRTRWSEEPFRGHAEEFLAYLSRKSSTWPSGLPKNEELIDLRGLAFPKPKDQATFALSSRGTPEPHEVTMVSGRMKTLEVKIDNVDLSLADLSETVFEKCNFRNVSLRNSTLSECAFRECLFEDVHFEKADLHGTTFASFEPNVFRRAIFAKANLRDTVHGYSLFEDCDFSLAKLDGIDFGGSRFVRSKFAGRMSEVTFRGWYSTADEAQRKYFSQHGTNVDSMRNPMRDVDFSEAYLDWCMFLDGIDLSRCKFPTDGAHIIVPDRDRVYKAMEGGIQANWPEPTREKALTFLRFISGWTNQEGQKMDVINRRSYEEDPEYKRDLPWLRRFFDTLNQAAEAPN